MFYLLFPCRNVFFRGTRDKTLTSIHQILELDRIVYPYFSPDISLAIICCSEECLALSLLELLKKSNVYLLWPLTLELPFFDFTTCQQVLDDNPDSISAAVRNRITSDDPDLTSDERLIIREFLEAYPDEEWSGCHCIYLLYTCYNCNKPIICYKWCNVRCSCL